MVFKLVRVDSQESCKIQLPTGKHLIGRGKLLSCDDKRISRNHGELEVSHDAVIVKALHQNPCYIRKKETEDIQLLKLNCTTNIDSGDRFGLLPDSYWFELMHCFAGDFDKEITSNIPESNVDACSTQTEATESYQNENELQDISSNLNESIANQSINSPSILSTENKDEPETNNDDQSKSSDPKSPLKRTYSSSDDSADDVKKIKTEDVKIKLEPDVGEETDDEEKPSNDEPKPSNSSADKNTASPSSAQNPHGRERCMYGANCYRRNPQHRVQFSHPGDGDWGAGERGECPWGAACRRRDPRHWRDHNHPPAAQPPPVRPPNNQGNKKRKPKRKYSSSEDDELSPVQNVLGKRTRKTVNRQNDWDGLSESENEEDPYQTDESDDWEPLND